MKPQSRDTSIEAEKMQIALLRKLNVSERLLITRWLTSSTLKMAKNVIKKCNPDKNQNELNLIFAEVVYGNEIADQLRKFYASQ